MGRDRTERDGPRRSDGRRRAALYLAQLAWLEGCPEGARWRRFDTEALIELDGALIAKSRRAARTVMREHPDVLPRLVGDVDRWWAIVDAKLAWCSHKAPFDPVAFLPPRTARLLRAMQAGPLAVAAAHAAIAWVADATTLERILGWLAARTASLLDLAAPEPDRVALQLARLAVIGDAGKAEVMRARAADQLLALVALDAPEQPRATLAHVRWIADRLRDTRATFVGATARSRPRVFAWLERLLARDPDERQRALALIAVSGIADALAPWQAWERTHAALRARAAALADRDFDAWGRAEHAWQAAAKLVRALETAPVTVAITDIILEIDMLATAVFVRFHASIVRLLDSLPAALPAHARARMLLHLARISATADDDEHLEWLWDALAVAFERGAPAGLLAPWEPALTKEARLFLDSDLMTSAGRRADAQRVVHALAELARRGDVTAMDGARVAAWHAAGLPEATLLELVPLLRDIDDRRDPVVARAILALSDGTPGDLAAVAALVAAPIEDLSSGRVHRLAALIEHVARGGGGWLVRDTLAAKRGAALIEVANVLHLLPRSTWPAMARGTDATGWIARYPAILAPALRRLASVDPDAERGAANRLATDLPDPAALRAEIAALRERSGAGPAKRLANLERRLASPALPSPARLARLASKLDRAACEIGLARFTSAITTRAAARLVDGFGLTELPAWTVDRKARDAMFELPQLDEPADRALAGRLLRARAGPPPWDLRDDPKNRAFVDAMRAAGVDPAPWLDDSPRTVVTESARSLTLALCSDPIEVFAMGSHFETCLSPGGGNFFSVLANAADVNKRVLYARRGDRVVGRCLLALTDGFGLLAFHPYCHEAIRFPDLVKDFALDLARRMNTSLVPRGRVRTLVARDWYDDGPRDLVGRFQGLGDDFDLGALEPGDLVERLRAALGRDIDDVTLPIIIGHRELRHHPRLLSPLVPFVLASSMSNTRIAAAQLAFDAGERDLADRLLGEHDEAMSITDHAWPYCELLARLRPSVALARLRETRARHVRSWRGESPDRIALAATALEALHRPRQAAAMYRLAMRESWMADSMRARLVVLGEPVDRR